MQIIEITQVFGSLTWDNQTQNKNSESLETDRLDQICKIEEGVNAKVGGGDI